MQPLIVRGEITARGGGEAHLPVHRDTGAVSIAIPASAAQGARAPMRSASAILKELWMLTQRGGYDINPAVIPQVSKRSATSGDRYIGTGIASHEVSCAIHRQQRRLAIFQRLIVHMYVVEYVSLNDKGVFPSVVVEVFKAYTPSRHSSRQRAESGF